VHRQLASTAISRSGPSDRSLRSISAVDPWLFFFTERCSVFFAPDISACWSMMGGAEFSGSICQRAKPLPTCASGRRHLRLTVGPQLYHSKENPTPRDKYRAPPISAAGTLANRGRYGGSGGGATQAADAATARRRRLERRRRGDGARRRWQPDARTARRRWLKERRAGG
jgi:hypothetical protein